MANNVIPNGWRPGTATYRSLLSDELSLSNPMDVMWVYVCCDVQSHGCHVARYICAAIRTNRMENNVYLDYYPKINKQNP